MPGRSALSHANNYTISCAAQTMQGNSAPAYNPPSYMHRPLQLSFVGFYGSLMLMGVGIMRVHPDV